MTSYIQAPRYFYPESQPALNDIVMADIKDIRNTAVYGTLPAYGDAEVMLPTSEINVRRGKRVSDYVRVGDLIPVQVISVTGDKIDVSMKLVREHEATEAKEKYHKSTRIYNIVRSSVNPSAAETEVRAIYEKHLWPIGIDAELFAFFEQVRAGNQEHDLPPSVVSEIMTRMPPPVFTASNERVIRFGLQHDGVAQLTATLTRLAAMEGVQVFNVAPPKYRLVASGSTQEEADRRLVIASASIPAPC
jgi:translation initiation factor 2 alpha subunit (eIF-2alpha)